VLFKDIIGQEEVKQRLIQTVKDNRISHAQLFFGPEGTGKLALAIAYAQYANCENKQEHDSCGGCFSCLKYNKIAHPDLHFFFPIATTKSVTKDPVSAKFLTEWRDIVSENPYLDINLWYEKINIENKQGIINAADCNEILRILSLKSYEAEYKVVILWMVEKLYHAAGPKLLKILEEPPQNTMFLLITDNPDQILKTILSRTQMVRIPRISDEELMEALIKRNNIEPEQARYFVSVSNGSYSEALRFIQYNGTENDFFPIFRNWMRLCFVSDFAGLCNWIDEMAPTGREKQKAFLVYASTIIHQCLKIVTRENYYPFASENETEFLSRFSKFINKKNARHFYNEINEAAWHIERNANARIVLMDMSLSIINLLKMKE